MSSVHAVSWRGLLKLGGLLAAAVVVGALVPAQRPTATSSEGSSRGSSRYWTLEEAWQAIPQGAIARALAWAEHELARLEGSEEAASLAVADLFDFKAVAICYSPDLDVIEECGSEDPVLLSFAIRERLWSTGGTGAPMTWKMPTAERRAPLERALADAEERLGANDRRLVPLLRALSANHMHQPGGSHRRARELAERVLEIMERDLDDDDLRLAEPRFQLARCSWKAGDYEAAGHHLDRSIERYRELGLTEHPGFAWRLNLSGILFMEQGDFRSAQIDLEESLRIRRERFPRCGETKNPEGCRSDLWQSLDNLADLFFRMGDLAQAETWQRQVAEEWLAVRGTEDADVALAKVDLANVLAEQGRDEEALRHTREAMTLLENKRGNEVEGEYYGLALRTLGMLQVRRGQFEEGEASLERSVELLEYHFGPDHPQVARALLLRSRARREQGKLEPAREDAERARRGLEATLGPTHPLLSDALRELALVEDAAHPHSAAAVGLALRGAAILTQHVRQTARSLPEQRALQYRRVVEADQDVLLDLATKRAATAPWDLVFNQVIRARAVVLDEMARRARRFAADQRSESVEQGKLNEAHEQLAALALRDVGALGHPSEDKVEATAARRELWDRLIQSQESLEERLAEEDPAFRAELRMSGAGLGDVRARLPAGSALVSYVRFGCESPAYGAFVLRAVSEPPRFVPLGPAARIDGAVRRLRDEARKEPPAATDAAREAERRYREVAGALGRLAWDPVASHVGDATLVFLVPDGELSLVNFAALVAEDGRYLVEAGPTLHILSAERDLVRSFEPARSAGSLLAFGDPDFDAASPLALVAGSEAGVRPLSSQGAATPVYRGPTSSCLDAARSFSPLPNAALEVDEVGSLWRNGAPTAVVDVVKGPQATEHSFKTRAQDHQVLHLATHGFFVDAACGARQPKGSAAGAQASFEENPLLRAGLVFAGANARGHERGRDEADDGILTAEEITSVDLTGVGWAVLSACETGLGDVQSGEGVMGLRRAFAIAGARTVIMSLWDVTDDDTRHWMKELYSERLAGATTADAIHRASLARLRDQAGERGHTHPYYWGAFVAAGDWR